MYKKEERFQTQDIYRRLFLGVIPLDSGCRSGAKTATFGPTTENDTPIILGIDPGTRIAGYAFLRSKKKCPFRATDFFILDAGALKVDSSLDYTERIALLHGAIFDLISTYKPDTCVLEKAFLDKNVNSALKLGEVRGAFIAAAGRCQVEVREVSPTQVKKTIAAHGRADKEQVSLAIKAQLGFDRGSLPYDVTDALAIALSFGLTMASNQTLAKTIGMERELS